jgi:hypothetical protein
MEFFIQVNWIAVILGGVFNMLVGSLWYGPLFGKLWLKVIGKKQEDIQSSATMYLLPLAASLVASYILAVLIAGLGITLWWQGLIMGIVVWLGIGATATFTTGTFEDVPRGAWALFALYQLVVYTVQGLVFAVWRL